MAFIGLDPKMVSGAAKKLQTESSNLDVTIGRIDRLVNQAAQAWQGADARNFVRTWQSTDRSAMKSGVSLLSQMSSTLTRNVAEQQQASKAAGPVSRPSQRPPAGQATPPGYDNLQIALQGVSQFRGPWGFAASYAQLYTDTTLSPADPQDQIGHVAREAGDVLSTLGSIADLAEDAGMLQGLGVASTGVLRNLGIAGAFVGAMVDEYEAVQSFEAGDIHGGVVKAASGALYFTGAVLMSNPATFAVGAGIVIGTMVAGWLDNAYTNDPAFKNFVDRSVDEFIHPVRSMKQAWDTLKSWFG